MALRFLEEEEFSAASFADAVNHFIASGEGAAVQELLKLAKDDCADMRSHVERGFSPNERTGWICRVLFELSHRL